MKTFPQLTALSEKELQQEIEKSSAELVEIRMNLTAGSEGDHSKYRKTRRYLARLKTARRQKDLNISSSPNS